MRCLRASPRILSILLPAAAVTFCSKNSPTKPVLTNQDSVTKGGIPLRKAFGALALTMMIVSCASTTPAAEKVLVTGKRDVIRGCKFLGKVNVTSGWSGTPGADLAGSGTDRANLAGLSTDPADLAGSSADPEARFGLGLVGSSTQTKEKLQDKTAELGGNAVFVVSSRIHESTTYASGEAYRCEIVPSEPEKRP